MRKNFGVMELFLARQGRASSIPIVYIHPLERMSIILTYDDSVNPYNALLLSLFGVDLIHQLVLYYCDI